MNLIKTSLLTFIATAIKMISGLVINKAVSIYIGPSGLALVGQFHNFMQLTLTLAQGAINNGVTKYTAEYGKDSPQIPLLFSTASRISIVCSVVVGGVIIAVAPWASEWFLKSVDYVYVFVVFGFTLVLFVLNNLLLSIINGLKEIKTFVSINIIQSLYSLVFTSLLIVFMGLHGALLALATNQSVVFFVILYLLRKHSTIRLHNFRKGFSGPEGKKLLGYAAMALTSAATVPVSHLLIRNFLGETLGWDQAGYWQAIWYISTMYLMVVTTSLSIYYLPRLSEIQEKAELRREILNGYAIILPIVILLSSGIFFLKDFIIWLLFTPDFYPMRELFLIQLVGDVVKIVSWLLAYLMLAKAMTKAFILTEIVFSASFVGLVFYFVSFYGLVGVTYAYAVNYILYLLIMAWIVKGEIYEQRD
ncbi:PST family polysaccharide transporter [Desulfobotulus alkaliphilus]|uniref:PST family polysaccharide transporter n=1 Tax=Desulfobotulus alkaliphilus TaxID=622671 RepID=A0A562S6B8_9BACT|nr:O-antigen translocase [Desulfobotulus alkaliphilus]TWI76909.1 PST family polysaccharide transporter [Desulfobotulus alkaliphilus]